MTAITPDLIHSGLLASSAATPGKVALISDDQLFTFAEVVARARDFAMVVEARGGKRVALCLPNSPVVIDTFFGTLMAGGCVCLFDPGWPTVLLSRLTADHAPDLVVSSETLRVIMPSGTFDQSLKSQPSPDTAFLLGFTSGSSGTPKGFLRNHRTWVESFRHSARELGTAASDCVVAPGPLSHGLSLYAVIEALCAGATAIIQSRFNASDVLAAIKNQNATTLVVVPAMLDVLLEQASGTSYLHLKRIVTAGAKLSPSLRQRAAMVFPNAETIEYYGASELSFITVAKGSENIPPASVGRAFSGVEIEVRDVAGRAVAPGEVGTVWVKSDMICSGYVGPTDGSGLRVNGMWATVGDFGHQDENGYLFLDGREGSAITSAGYTVYPSAIESALLAHPLVSDAAVLGLPDPRWGEIIAAAVVPVSGSTLSETDLTDHCRAVLEPYACPRQWVIPASLERTPSGKIKRLALAALFES